MDNVIDFEGRKRSCPRKTDRLGALGTSKGGVVIFFTGVRVEYEKGKIVPGGPPNPAKIKTSDV